MATAPKSASSNQNFELCPAGSHQLVCCDVVDIGIIDSKWNGTTKPQHKVRLRFQTGLKMKDGKPYLVQRQFTWSMFKSAALRKFCEIWRGLPFSDQEADEFDFDRLIGVNGWSTIVHTQTNRGIFADVQSIMPLPPGMPKLEVSDYVRVKDRPKEQPQTAQAAAQTTHGAAAPNTAGPGFDPFADPPPPTDADLARGSFQPAPDIDDDDLPF